MVKRRRRVWALLLSAALITAQLPSMAMAVTNDEGLSCESHQRHDADCGYVESRPCGHTEHAKDCYTDELICGFDGGVVQTATDSEADESHEHIQKCYDLDCPHERGEHDDTCGFAAAQPCGHECELCVSKDSTTPPDTSGENVQKSTSSDAVLATVASPTPSGTITGNGYSFDPDDGSLTISSGGGTEEWRKNTEIEKNAVISVVVEHGVEAIRSYAFSNCTNLARAELPSSVTSIEQYAFYDCSKLALTELPDSVTSIGQYAFSGCSNLALTEIPANVTSIAENAFSGCTGLETLDLSHCTSLQSIGNEAFQGCANLTSLVFNDSAPTLGKRAFADTASGLAIFIPKSAKGYDNIAWTDYRGNIVTSVALSKLEISEGTLEPVFFPMTHGYSVSVPHTVESVIVTPTLPTVYENSTIVVNESHVASGSQSAAIPLTLGETKSISISVKSADSTETRVYSIGVTRYASVVSLDTIQGVTPPALGEAPVTAITETAEYTGVVKWNPDPGVAFAADTDYTATIMLSPKTGYTLQGVTANFFKVDNATSVSSAENSGIIQAVFPTTGKGIYTMSADKISLNFGNQPVGYAAAPAAQTIAITNTGNQTVTLNQPTAINYEVGALSKTELMAGETAAFTVRPKHGLAENTYSETITVSNTQGRSVSVALSFSVTAKPTYAVTVNGGTGGGSSGPSYYSRTLTHEASGVKVEGSQIHEYATLSVTAMGLHNAGDAGCDLLRQADKTGRVLSLYDVSLSRVFRGSVTVSIPALGRDGQTLTVVHCTGGNLVLSNVTVKNGMAAVTAEELSPFAVLNGVYTPDTLAAPATGNPFTDVKEPDWYYNAVLYAYQNGLMNGATATTFDPQGIVTRAQPPVALYRLEGSPAVTAQNPFADVRSGLWYANGITWAAGAGLADGYNATAYGPGDAVTREQLAVMFWRYAKYKGWDVSMGEDTNLLSYADALDVSEWAVPALQWACGAGIMANTPDNRLAPKDGITRAELAGMLQRLMEKYQRSR